VKRRGGDARTIGLFGQELITITAAIARMNLVLHGVSDFHIAAGNTLAAPAFAAGDRLRTFDMVLANPPYSIKKWNRCAWESDSWGRNFPGTPPQGLPITPSSSTSCAAWSRGPGVAPFSSRMGCFSATRRPGCGGSLSSPTWSSACWAWDRDSSTTSDLLISGNLS
jgi:hypothetical protein